MFLLCLATHSLEVSTYVSLKVPSEVNNSKSSVYDGIILEQKHRKVIKKKICFSNYFGRFIPYLAIKYVAVVVCFDSSRRVPIANLNFSSCNTHFSFFSKNKDPLNGYTRKQPTHFSIASLSQKSNKFFFHPTKSQIWYA